MGYLPPAALASAPERGGRADPRVKRGSSQPAGEPPSQPPSQPRSPPRRTVSHGLPPYLTRYIVALCREDDPAPCPRVATPAQPLEHPDIGRYFSGFDPQRGYLPTAELAARYPDG